MRAGTRETQAYYILRVAAAMCFIGHGAFGLIGKQIWVHYFAVFGIDDALAWRLMPIVGSIDILFGLSLLLHPTRAVFGWLVVWGTTTALLRPLSGEPVAETLERAGNYGVPLTMLLLYGAGTRWRSLFDRVGPELEVSEAARARALRCLRVVVFLLMVGHGWLNLIAKQSILDQYARIGFHDPEHVARLVGLFEVTAAVAVLMRPARSVLIALVAWKMGTELLYPHYEVLEWIERGGSYGSILAMIVMLPRWSTSTVRASALA